jgi:hypothetical protein
MKKTNLLSKENLIQANNLKMKPSFFRIKTYQQKANTMTWEFSLFLSKNSTFYIIKIIITS